MPDSPEATVPPQDHFDPKNQLAKIKEQSQQAKDRLFKHSRTAYGTAEQQFGEHEEVTASDLRKLIEKLREEEERGSITPGDAAGIRRALIARNRSLAEGETSPVLKEISDKERENLQTAQSYNLESSINSELSTLRQAYEDYLRKLYEDGALLRDIGSNYIEMMVKPEIDELFSGKSITPEQAETLLATIRRIYDEKITDVQEREEILKPFFNKYYGNLDQRLYEIKDGIDFRALNQIVSYEFFADRGRILEVARVPDVQRYKYLSPHSLPQFSQAPLFAQDKDLRSIYGGLFGDRLTISRNATSFDHTDFETWLTLRSSPGAREIFGQTVDQIDRHNYEALLAQSLVDSNGSFIDALRHYPEPETIRNLVLIAAADTQNYRTVHANWTLRELAQRPDWNNILDQATTVYPELGKARPVLESWQHGEYWQQPDIRQAASDFALRMSLESGDNKTISSMALEALDARQVVALIKQRGLIGEDAAVLQRALQIAKEKVEDEHFYQYLDRDVRQACVKLYNLEGSYSLSHIEEARRSLGKLSRYANELIASEGDPQRAYLADSAILGLITQDGISDEKMELILKNDAIPIVLSTIRAFNILSGESKTLLNPEGLKFLKSIVQKGDAKQDLIFPVIWDLKDIKGELTPNDYYFAEKLIDQAEESDEVNLFADSYAQQRKDGKILSRADIDQMFGRWKPFFEDISRRRLTNAHHVVWTINSLKIISSLEDIDLAFGSRILAEFGQAEDIDQATIVYHYISERNKGRVFTEVELDEMIDKWKPLIARIQQKKLEDPNFGKMATYGLRMINFLEDGDLNFLLRVFDKLNNVEDVATILNYYIDERNKGRFFAEDELDDIFKGWEPFLNTHTGFSLDRLVQYKLAESRYGSEFGEQITFDLAHYILKDQDVKIKVLEGAVKRGDPEEIKKVAAYLRWLPESEVSSGDTAGTLEIKYGQVKERFETALKKVFANGTNLLQYPDVALNLATRLNAVCRSVGMKMQTVAWKGIRIEVPVEFVDKFSTMQVENPDRHILPDLIDFAIDQIVQRSTAYTVEDLIYAQITDLNDPMGRRSILSSPEDIFARMRENIEASFRAWSTAAEYQNQTPEKPLFIIANERTAPADLAAEYLPKALANRLGLNQEIDYEKFFEWFRQRRDDIDEIYQVWLSGGEEPDETMLAEARNLLLPDNQRLVPIYRIKIPSSLNAATDEPQGIEDVLTFLKLTSILGGKTLFIDESTRSAPRSIECLYNALNRRQGELNGVSLRFFGKAKDAVGQNGTRLSEIFPDQTNMEVAFLDPWESQEKSYTDDTAGFVPELSGSRVVEIVKPSYIFIGPTGVSTVQDFWKTLIALEVSKRL